MDILVSLSGDFWASYKSTMPYGMYSNEWVIDLWLIVVSLPKVEIINYLMPESFVATCHNLIPCFLIFWHHFYFLIFTIVKIEQEHTL